MSWRIQAVEHRKCVTGPAGAHLGLQDRILQNHTRIENAHEVRKKLSIFIMYRSPANFYFSFFPVEALPNSWMLLVKKAVFELVEQFYHATKIANVANAVSLCVDQPKQTK